MKSDEIYLKDVLVETINREIFAEEDDYSRFDCWDNNNNIYELKVRSAYYDDVLIEFDKFAYNCMYAQVFNKKFIYVVQMEDMGYVFNISKLNFEGYDFKWETRELPKYTEFYNKPRPNGTQIINKLVGYINAEDCHFSFKIW